MPRILIDDSNWQQHAGDVVIDGHRMGRGMTHDYEAEPVSFGAGVEPFSIPVIPREEWPERIADMIENRSRLSDIRDRANEGYQIPSYDQNGQGYCWAYSTGAAITIARAVANQPYKRLSCHGPACMIKNFRDQGGWNPLSVEFAMKHGYPTVETWPEKSMSRRNDNDATWEEAKQYRVTEGWMQLTPPVYDRNLSFDQLMTALLLRIPCPVDLMWWRHSVCALNPLDFNPGQRGGLQDQNRWGIGIWNSWRDAWGTNGYGEIRGRKAVPDGATAIKVVTAN